MSYPSIIAVFFTCFISCNSSLLAQSINFEENDWNGVLAKAKETGKPIFVDTYTNWCQPCKWMDKHVFVHPDVGAFFNQHYISYKLNMEQGEGMAFAEEYHVTSYPTFLYFDAEGTLVHRIVGAYDAEALIEQSQDALDPNQQIYTLAQRYEEGERDPEFLSKYTMALFKVNEPYQEMVAAYLTAVGNQALEKPKHFAFLERYIAKDYNHPAYRYVLEHRAAFIQTLGSQRVNRYLEAPFKRRGYELIDQAASKSKIHAYLQDVKSLLPDRMDYFKSRLEFYASRGDERKQYKVALKYEKHCRDAESLAILARYTLDLYGESSLQLNSALEWIDRALLLEESLYALETKALLLLALERKEEARTIAERFYRLSIDQSEYQEKARALMARFDG